MSAVYRRGSRVRVSSGPRGRRLSIDGTFASFWTPGEVLTRSVWDALAAPLLWHPPARRRSVLILGLGGGSAARLVRAIAPEARIVGVELDPAVVRAGKRHFDLDSLGIEVRTADALEALRRSRERFDAVIEDVFVGRGRAVHKPAWLPSPGFALAKRRLAPGGLLVSNALDESPSVASEIERLFPGALKIETAGYDNRVFVGGPPGLSARALRGRLTRDPVLAPAARWLSFRTLRSRPRGTGAPRGSTARPTRP